MRSMLGRHVANLPDPLMIIDFLKCVWIAQLLYTFAIASIKLAVLAFYWRLFAVKSRTMILVVAGMCIAWFIAIVSTALRSLISEFLTLTSLVVLRYFQLHTCTSSMGYYHCRRKVHPNPIYILGRICAQRRSRYHRSGDADALRVASTRSARTTTYTRRHVRPGNIHLCGFISPPHHLPTHTNRYLR